MTAAHDPSVTDTNDQPAAATEPETVRAAGLARGTVFRDKKGVLWRAGVRFSAHRIDQNGNRLDGHPWQRQAVSEVFGPLTIDEQTKRLTETTKS